MKMISALVLAVSLIVYFGCEKSVDASAPATASEASGVKSANAIAVTRPMKVHVTALANDALPPVQCLPDTYGAYYVGGGGWIKGTVTYLGEVNTESSPFIVTGCYLGPQANQVTELIEGTATAANGEAFTYTGSATVTMTDASLKGVINITGGTGKYSNAYGNVNISGTVNFTTGVAQWNGDGSITF